MQSNKDIEGDAVGSTDGSTDGSISYVKNFYFGDQAWVVRYVVVETGGWLASRKLLISPPYWADSTKQWAESAHCKVCVAHNPAVSPTGAKKRQP